MSTDARRRESELTPARATHMNGRAALLIATLVTIALWFVPDSNYVLYPLRILVTFIHESGHALAAVMTGGSVQSLHVSPDGSGVTYTYESPAWAWLVLSAGYLGSALFGAMLLQVSRLGRWRDAGRTTLFAASALILLATVMWVRNPFTNGFTLLSGLVLATGLFSLGRFLPSRAAYFVAVFLAIQCSLNSLTDLRTLLYVTSNRLGDNDALFMSRQYGLAPTVWAVLWAVAALLLLALSLRSIWRATGRDGRGSGHALV